MTRDRGDWRLEGQSLYNEMHHFTSNRADGSGFARCLAGVTRAAAGRRVWFKGHGTGTRLVIEERGLPLADLPGHGAGWQAHAEDLATYLSGRQPAPWRERWVELREAYEPLGWTSRGPR